MNPIAAVRAVLRRAYPKKHMDVRMPAALLIPGDFDSPIDRSYVVAHSSSPKPLRNFLAELSQLVGFQLLHVGKGEHPVSDSAGLRPDRLSHRRQRRRLGSFAQPLAALGTEAAVASTPQEAGGVVTVFAREHQRLALAVTQLVSLAQGTRGMAEHGPLAGFGRWNAAGGGLPAGRKVPTKLRMAGRNERGNGGLALPVTLGIGARRDRELGKLQVLPAQGCGARVFRYGQRA